MRNFGTMFPCTTPDPSLSLENFNVPHRDHVDLATSGYPDSWVGFDFDGTLATYKHPTLPDGEPIHAMVEHCRKYISAGMTVKIFTARAADKNQKNLQKNIEYIESFCLKHIGMKLEITCVKDHKMIRLYDDRAVSVARNAGDMASNIEPGK